MLLRKKVCLRKKVKTHNAGVELRNHVTTSGRHEERVFVDIGETLYFIVPSAEPLSAFTAGYCTF